MLEYTYNILYSGLTIILRLPSLLFLDIFYRTDHNNSIYGVQMSTFNSMKYIINMVENILLDNPDEIDIRTFQNTDNSDQWLFELLLSYLSFFTMFSIAFLHISKVVLIYLHIISAALLYLAASCSREFILKVQPIYSELNSVDIITTDVKSPEFLFVMLANFVLQIVISCTVAYLLNFSVLGHIITSSMVLPTLSYIFLNSSHHLYTIHNLLVYFMCSMTGFYLISISGKVMTSFKELYYQLQFVGQLYGWIEVPLRIWTEYRLSEQLLMFWLSLFISNLFRYLSTTDVASLSNEKYGYYFFIFLQCISDSSLSPISMMALCITVSYVSFAVLSVTKYLLHGSNADIANDNILQRGWAEGFTMLLIALQVDIFGVNASQRTNVMIIVMFIIVSSLLDSMHEIVSPHLLQLGASQGSSKARHFCALLLSSLLLVLPLYMAYFIIRLFETDFWLLIIVSGCLLTSIQVLSTLIIYSLFIYDRWRSDPYANLDDIIFYIKSFVRILEFLVALTVVTFSVKEFLFGQWSLVSVVILTVHFYFNVWQRMQTGWKSYLMRRSAIKRLKMLSDATYAELSTLNDICSICFGDMLHTGAKKTHCNHFFHTVCLRKWLFVKETCPMCQQKIAAESTEYSGSDDQGHNVSNNQDNNSEVSEDMNDLSSSNSSIYDDQDIDLCVYIDDDIHRNNTSNWSDSERGIDDDPGSSSSLDSYIA